MRFTPGSPGRPGMRRRLGSWRCTTCRAGMSSTGSSRSVSPGTGTASSARTCTAATAMPRSQGGVRDDSVVAVCAAALSWLKAQPYSNGRAGIIGTCSGGRHALLAASRVAGFDAVADLWGGGVVMAQEDLSEARPVAPIDYTADLTAPLLGIFGNDDQHPSPEQVNQHEAELRRHGKDYEFYRYDGAGHGFLYYHAPMYRPEAAMDAWEKAASFFGRHLST